MNQDLSFLLLRRKMSQPHRLVFQQEGNAPLFLDALYCSEEKWEVGGEEGSEEDNDMKVPVLVEQDMFWEDEELISLFSREQEMNQLYENYNVEKNESLIELRRDAVEWMLNVHSYYSFSALTAVLAVNYLDRFISSFQFQREKPWMSQLVSIACLSLAAKVEETQVPLLLDFQVEETKYRFEAKTIQRMEVLILSSLHWRMNPVNPLSFLDHITRRLGLNSFLSWEFVSRCENVILSILSDSRYMCYLPSVVATATMLHVINCLEPNLLVRYQEQLMNILSINKEQVDHCYDLVLELASRHRRNQSNKRKFGSSPGSPKGVMDASFSSDSSNDSWAMARSVTSSPEPTYKKAKFADEHVTSDVLGIHY